MKKLLFISVLFFTINAKAQLIQGDLKINTVSKIEIIAKSNKAVNLYSDFREGKYNIHFAFTGIDIPVNSEKKEVVQFVFSTIVKKDKITIGSITSSPIPFFPGDMLMPVETFDFISILSNIKNNTKDKISEIPFGNYEIIIEVKPIGVKGSISPLRLFLKVI